MNRQLLILCSYFLFPNVVVSQSHDSITLKGDNNIAMKRCYMCAGIKPHDSSSYFSRFGDSISNWLITAYFKGGSIQKIKESVDVKGKDYEGKILLIYKFYRGKLIEADDDNPGATYRYLFQNDRLTKKSEAVDDLGWFTLSPNEALKYSQEDKNVILQNKMSRMPHLKDTTFVKGSTILFLRPDSVRFNYYAKTDNQVYDADFGYAIAATIDSVSKGNEYLGIKTKVSDKRYIVFNNLKGRQQIIDRDTIDYGILFSGKNKEVEFKVIEHGGNYLHEIDEYFNLFKR